MCPATDATPCSDVYTDDAGLPMDGICSLGITELDGQWQQGCGYFVDPLIPFFSVCAPDPINYTLAVSENFEGELVPCIVCHTCKTAWKFLGGGEG